MDYLHDRKQTEWKQEQEHLTLSMWDQLFNVRANYQFIHVLFDFHFSIF